MTEKQKELKRKHGGPKQFAKAVWKACADLFITGAEAEVAIQSYEAEWKAAGNNNQRKAMTR